MDNDPEVLVVGTLSTVDIRSCHMVGGVEGRRKGGHTEAVGHQEEHPKAVCCRHRGNVAGGLLRYYRQHVDKRLEDFRRDEADNRDVADRDASRGGGRREVDSLMEKKDILGVDCHRTVVFVQKTNHPFHFQTPQHSADQRRFRWRNLYFHMEHLEENPNDG